MADKKYLDGDGVAQVWQATKDYVDAHSGYNPAFSVGRADALTGADSTAQWAQRESTGSGTAIVRSVQGATVVWNQLIKTPYMNNAGTYAGISFAVSAGYVVTASGTSSSAGNYFFSNTMVLVAGHKYAFCGVDYMTSSPAGATFRVYDPVSSRIPFSSVTNGIFTSSVDARSAMVYIDIPSEDIALTMSARPQIFDLTLMFGAGNEPATVAEFERMFPDSYYPYSAPTLKPVQIAGIRSVGFNQWDGAWSNGALDGNTGAEIPNRAWSRTGFIPALPDTEYYLRAVGDEGYRPHYYDTDKRYISTPAGGMGFRNNTFTTPSGTGYIRLMCSESMTPNGMCLNLSNPALNGQCKPYMTDSIEWSTQTLRAAGSVRDKLTADELVTRVGVVDLGTLTWARALISESYGYRFVVNRFSVAKAPVNNNTMPNFECSGYDTITSNQTAIGTSGISLSNSSNLIIYDAAKKDMTATDFKAAMSGVYLFYELATPTTTPITPALPMTYRVEQGGTESIIVPDGEISATPVLTVAEGESAADVVMDALACIATPDGPVATVNHAINTYLTMQGKLYKVATAIAAGETIAAGTNVTQTTVMDELIALTA